MKKTRLLPIAAISLMISLVGCNWQIPENVSVKTNAEYEFSAGEFNKSLNEYLDLKKLMGDKLPAGMAMYDYFPGEKNPDVQRYLMSLSKDIDLPLKSIKDGLSNIDSALTPIEINKKIDINIPKIDMPNFGSIDIDLVEVKNIIKTNFQGYGKTGTSAAAALFPNSFDDGHTVHVFEYPAESVTFKNLKLKIEAIDPSAMGGGSAVKLPDGLIIKVKLDGQKELEATAGTNGIYNIEATSDTVVSFKDATYTATSTKGPVELPFKLSLDSSSEIKSLNNLTKDKQIPIPESSLTVNNFLPKGIKNCKIGEGNLTIKLNDIENATYSAHLESTGGISLDTNVSNANNIIDLSNVKLTPKVSNVTLTGEINLRGATVTFNNPNISIAPNLTKISEITADIEELGSLDPKLTFEQTVDLPNDVSKIVRTLGINPSGIDISYSNTLTAGNDITLVANSKFLNIKDKETVFASGVDSSTASIRCDKTEITIPRPKDNVEITKIDFNVSVKLPGSTKDNPNLVTLKNIELAGGNYAIEIKTVTPVLDWDYVKVDSKEVTGMLPPEAKNIKQNLGINLNKQLKELETKLNQPNLFNGISLTGLPIYMFCKADGINALNNLKIKGNAKVYFADSDQTVQKQDTEIGYILGNETTSGEISLINNMPKLPNDAKQVITEDFDKIAEVSFKVAPETIANFVPNILSTDGNLCMGVELSEITSETGGDIQIFKQDLESMKETGKLHIAALVDVGLALKLDNELTVNLLNIENLKNNLKGKDVLNGSLKTIKDQGIDKYLEVIKEISVNCNLRLLPIQLDKDITFHMGLNNGKNDIDPINIALGKGQVPITLTKKQIKDLLLSDNPQLLFNDMTITIPKGQLSVPRAKDVTAGLSVKLVTDGSIDLMTNGQPAFGGTK